MFLKIINYRKLYIYFFGKIRQRGENILDYLFVFLFFFLKNRGAYLKEKNFIKIIK